MRNFNGMSEVLPFFSKKKKKKKRKKIPVLMCVLLGVCSSSLSGNDAMDINLRLTTSHIMDADRMLSALAQDFKSFTSCSAVAEVRLFFIVSKKRRKKKDDFLVVVFKL